MKVLMLSVDRYAARAVVELDDRDISLIRQYNDPAKDETPAAFLERRWKAMTETYTQARDVATKSLGTTKFVLEFAKKMVETVEAQERLVASAGTPPPPTEAGGGQ